jgi:hypothetical protein
MEHVQCCLLALVCPGASMVCGAVPGVRAQQPVCVSLSNPPLRLVLALAVRLVAISTHRAVQTRLAS